MAEETEKTQQGGDSCENCPKMAEREQNRGGKKTERGENRWGSEKGSARGKQSREEGRAI